MVNSVHRKLKRFVVNLVGTVSRNGNCPYFFKKYVEFPSFRCILAEWRDEMKKKTVIVIVVYVLILATSYVPVKAQQSVHLSDVIVKSLGTSGAGVSVRESETGTILYQFNGNIPRKPASTLKLLTGAAALSLLGEEYRYTTGLYVDGRVSDGIVNGDVYLKGSGDPTLQYSHLLNFAQALKNEGITQINGNLYGDDRVFFGDQLTPGIVAEDESYYYAARTTGLVLSPNDDYDAGTIIVQATGEKAGEKPTLQLQPNAMGMTIRNNATTVSAGNQNTLSITRTYRTNEVMITGTIAVGSTKKEWVTVDDPTINTMQAMKEALVEQGISFTKTPTISRGTVPTNATAIMAHHSQPLKDMFATFMKLSNNSMADIFVKTLGAQNDGVGNTQTGLKVLREYGQSIGLNMSNWSLEDGSGMSHNNRISPNALTELLYNTRNMEAYETYYDALPIGGDRDRFIGGSLRDRYTSTSTAFRVFAKTGAISGVNTLAGFVKAKSGQTYIFSIMIENRATPSINGIDAVVSHIINNY